MNNQLASLQKGLIFHAPLDEWHSSMDLVSQTAGVKTDVYNVLDRRGSGRRSLSLNGTSDYVTLPTIAAFGTGGFSVVIKFRANGLSGTQCILGGWIL